VIPIFLAAALLMAGAPDAPPAPAATPAAAAKAKPDASTVVCWNEPRPGSHMVQKVCGTQAAVDLRAQQAQSSVDQVRGRGNDQEAVMPPSRGGFGAPH
jgi:hypothetical protein